MSDGRGRKPLWSATQAERVLSLAAEGVSHREIAKQVFGRAGLHGRVGRILGSRRPTAEAAEGEPVDLQALLPEDVEAGELRQLFRFYDRMRARTGTEPSLADIERLLKIHVRLQGVVQLERMNALFRESGMSGDELLDALGKT